MLLRNRYRCSGHASISSIKETNGSLTLQAFHAGKGITLITALGRGTVLIADENPERAQSLKNRVSSMGYSASIQSNARKTLRKIRSRSVNAVIISASIGDMHISGFLETLRKANLATGIVIYGKNISAEDAINWMKSGAVDVILHIEAEQALKAAIQRAFSFSSMEME